MEINEAIIEQAKDCNNDFSCLKNKEHIYCKIKSSINNSVHFVQCVDSRTCNYNISFGDSQICTCPVRKEIYTKFKI